MEEKRDYRGELYEILVHNHADFDHEWKGWKLRGAALVSPDGQRLRSPQLRALFWNYGTTLKKRVRNGTRKEQKGDQLELFDTNEHLSV